MSVNSVIFFSVIIPLYNKEPHIERAVKSVLNQTFSNFELIVIDDASTDNSLQKLKQIEIDDIKVYQRDVPGPGGYAARNLGIKNANGRYIAFLDADDEWATNHLEEIYQLILKYPNADVYSCGWHLKKGNIKKTNSYFNKNVHKGCHIVQNYFKEARFSGNPLCSSVAVVEKSTIIDSGMFPEGKCRRGGDIETWMRLALKSQIAWTPNLGATYHKDSVNMVTQTVSKTEIPYVYYSIQKLLPSVNTQNKIDLKRYANQFANRSIFHSIIHGINIENTMKGYYKEADPYYYLFFRFLRLFPPFLLKPLFKVYRYLMLKFSRDQV